MASKYPFMPFYVADFAADTLHLSWQAKAAYRALLDAYWLRSRGLNDDDDELALIIGMTRKEWDSVRDKVLPFFTLAEGNVLTQKRMEAELSNAKHRTEVQVNRANKRWSGNATAMPRHSSGIAVALPMSGIHLAMLSTSTSTSIGEEEEKRKDKVDAAASTPRQNFVKPTLAEVEKYCSERGKGVNPEAWLDHYTSNGWRVGRNPMKSWQAAVRTWERSSFGPEKPVEMSDDDRRKRIAEILARPS